MHPEVLERDRIFRAASHEAETKLASTSSADLQKLHDSFIAAAGSSKTKSSAGPKAEKVPGTGFDELRKEHPNAYKPWNEDQDEQLHQEFMKGTPTADMAILFGRKKGAIHARLVKLGLIED